jgi:prepilin-type N-terminal cleavage/methylation domain-containing protein
MTHSRPFQFRCGAGFTLVELMIGLVVTALVMAALAGLTTAVAQGWKQSETTQSTTNVTTQVHLRVQRSLRAARLLGVCEIGSLDNTACAQAACLFWKGDANADNQIQFSELALLEYHPEADPNDRQTLRLYQVVWPAGWTAAQKAAADTTIADNNEIFDENEIDTFKNMTYVTYSVVARNVYGAEFHKHDGAQIIRPTLDYILVFPDGQTEFGSVVARCPNILPKEQCGG